MERNKRHSPEFRSPVSLSWSCGLGWLAAEESAERAQAGCGPRPGVLGRARRACSGSRSPASWTASGPRPGARVCGATAAPREGPARCRPWPSPNCPRPPSSWRSSATSSPRSCPPPWGAPAAEGTAARRPARTRLRRRPGRSPQLFSELSPPSVSPPLPLPPSDTHGGPCTSPAALGIYSHWSISTLIPASDVSSQPSHATR